MRELVQIYKPQLVVLMETKVDFKTMGFFFNGMGFTASAHVDPIGRSGGIWMLWNPDIVNVRVVEASLQQITAIISRQDYPNWLLSTVYVSLNNNLRDNLWDQLEEVAQNMTEPWLVDGDFNDFTTRNEKQSLQGNQNQKLSQDQRRGRKFNERVDNCKLMDLGCTGPRLTWFNNKKGWANTMARKGCQGYLCSILIEQSVNVEMGNISVVREFSDVFPNELPERLVDKEIEFTIDVVPGT
ncbi:uncharacterized protein LOC114261234 [Camellia sinensis]|uniref:uncharacterized protein LOC114261234 n=1 Tax=Camellia sinensis TaxID=4442 RepID=UPI00103677E4|nr:uncharacterized protein LOC114261234 [Camellia sinensis]